MNAPKMCSVCKEKPATLFLTNISADNKAKNLDLCDACAKAKGIDKVTSLSIADSDLKLGLGAAQEMEQSSGGIETKCPRCGFTQADFKKSGRLGCPECYKTFAEGLEGLLKTMHKGTRHAGKVPEALRESREQADRLKSLQKKLDKAIKEEDFEQAAQLRDELKQLAPRGPGLTVT